MIDVLIPLICGSAAIGAVAIIWRGLWRGLQKPVNIGATFPQPCVNCTSQFEGMMSDINSLKARVLELERGMIDARQPELPLVGASLRRAIASMEIRDELGLPRMEWNNRDA